MSDQNLPEGEMATAIERLAESLGGVAVARPEWVDFEKQKGRLGLAVIAVISAIQGHSDDWVKRDDLPKIIDQAKRRERERHEPAISAARSWLVREHGDDRPSYPANEAAAALWDALVALDQVDLQRQVRVAAYANKCQAELDRDERNAEEHDRCWEPGH